MMNSVHARCDEDVIENAFESDGQSPVGMLKKIGGFKQDFKNHERPEIDAEHGHNDDAKRH